MNSSTMSVNDHFSLIENIPINDMSGVMHEIGHELGTTTVEHGLIGFGDPNPVRIHSELIYHKDLLPYFMLGCVQQASYGGANIIYNGVKAARIVQSESPELQTVRMVYHAEHYRDTRANVPLIREKKGERFLTFRQKKGNLNEVHCLPEGWDEDSFYEYIDYVLSRSVELEYTLGPGEILVVNNYRTLHVRTAYGGERKIIRVRVDDPESHKKYETL